MNTTTPLLLHVPDPVGWIALSADALRAAQVLARGILTTVLDSTDVRSRPVAALLRAEEAARLLDVDASWLMRQAREGRIPSVKLGRFVRFDLREIVGPCTKAPIPRD